MDNGSSLNVFEKLGKSTAWLRMVNILRLIEGWLVISTLALVFFGVLLRYVFGISMLWSEEILIIVAIWMYFLGVVVATIDETHIKGDVVGGLIKKPKFRKIHVVTVSLYSVIVAIIFAIWVFRFLEWQLTIGAVTTFLRWPMATSQYAIVVGAVGMVIFFIFHLARYALMNLEKFALPSTTTENSENGGEDQ